MIPSMSGPGNPKFAWGIATAAILVLACYGCQGKRTPSRGGSPQSLAQAQKAHSTKLTRRIQTGDPLPEPPSGELKVVQYTSGLSKLAAYVSVPPSTKKRHPAIIWIFGGFDNSIAALDW
jgi:hypothetical protein